MLQQMEDQVYQVTIQLVIQLVQTYYGVAEAWDFDADIFDATGKLSPSTTPIDVTLQQASTGGDVLASGSYFISVDVALAPVLTKHYHQPQS
jgi:hypothetical protein